MEDAFVVNMRHAWLQRVSPREAHLAGFVLAGRLDHRPIAHQCFTTRLAVDRPARPMIVRLAVARTVIDMAKNAEPQFRILVEDLPLGHIVAEVSGDKGIVSQDVLDDRTYFLPALDTGIVR